MDKTVVERLEWMKSILPDSFKDEFENEVLVDGGEDYDIKTLENVFLYYIQDCWEELPDSVKKIIDEEYLVIELA